METHTQDLTKLSSTRAIAISASIIATQLVQMIPFGAGILSSSIIASELNAPRKASWIAASYPLTQGAFVLIGGRIGAIYGHKNVLIAACLWWSIFSLGSGFARNIVALIALRALTGIGGAFMVPNAISLLTINFPPGKLRNLSVGFFGAMAPIGASIGAAFAGLLAQLTPWKYLFFSFTILGVLVTALVTIIVPGETEPQAPFVGWREPYEYALLITAVVHLTAFVFWEARYAADPILPLDIWTAKSISPMLLASFISFMAVGIFVWYCNIWNVTLREYTTLLCAASFVPLAVGGTTAAIVSGLIVPVLDAQYILVIGSACTMVACILAATMPDKQQYWPQMFPAITILSYGPDFLFSASQIIASNTVKKNQQGIAGSLIGTIVAYGQSTGIGFAGTVEVYTNGHGVNIGDGYRHALYLGIGLAALSIIIAVLFIRIPKDAREGWGDDEPTVVGDLSDQSAQSEKNANVGLSSR
ncbi:efflux pump antibiotic resistance [Trichoderma arundinaceum]|uniref:Efflux pump antibiotic resistance n=1 Tax=Trichoderma arundinaceum TaxID=490622 RepID=A0A395NRR3_TRIAR|nr:efflux pump antibiotic resistance [Trichoderma arundinaceum]